MLRNKIIFLIPIVIIAFLIPAYDCVYRPNSAPPMGNLARIVIDKGDNLDIIAAKLDSTGLVDNPRKFVWACRLMRVERDFPAGIFVMPFGLSNRELVRRMLLEGVNTDDVTIREGWTATKIASVLQREIGVDSAALMDAVLDTGFVFRLGIEAPSLEGYLFPETYNFFLGMDARDIARRMARQFLQVFDDNMKQRAWELGLSVNQIATLASIIEGEIIFSSEAPIVSAVYHNRLKIGMRLQADPTIQYIIPDSPRRLKNSDLWIKSPYNTYRNYGLPPGPINNPGLRALKAALYPTNVPYLFFVARGDGYHNFNVTPEGHIADKRKFNRFRKKINRERRGTPP